MPLFLVHGFRWPRKDIRIFTILHKVEEATPDYLMMGSNETASLFKETLAEKYPDILRHLPNLTFIEQYDPEELTTAAQPYAYVADKVVRADLSIDITECMSQNLSAQAWDAMADLRDELARNEKVGWRVVWNGDVERSDLGPVETPTSSIAELQLHHSGTHGSLASNEPPRSVLSMSSGSKSTGPAEGGRGEYSRSISNNTVIKHPRVTAAASASLSSSHSAGRKSSGNHRDNKSSKSKTNVNNVNANACDDAKDAAVKKSSSRTTGGGGGTAGRGGFRKWLNGSK